MSSNQLLVQDFQIGETTDTFEYNGKRYTALLEYDPKRDQRAFLWIFEGTSPAHLKQDHVYHAWISALGANYTGRANSTSWYISHAVEPDKSLRSLFLNAMLRNFMMRPKNSSIDSFTVGSPKQIISPDWLHKYGVGWVNSNVITTNSLSVCPDETPLSKLLTLV
jgi:hypothetical protein